MTENKIKLSETLFEKDNKYFAALSRDNFYMISNEGAVYNSETRKLLKPYYKNKRKKNSHLCVDLIINGKYRTYYIHRLVAEVFLLNPKMKLLIHHINCNPYDNRAINLLWLNRGEHRHLHYLLDHNKYDEYNKEIERLRQESPLKEFTNCYMLEDR